MHTIDDKANGIFLNYNSDWRGDVRIGWYVGGTDPFFRAEVFPDHLKPPPPSLHECWCDGPSLIAGRFTLATDTYEPAPGAVVDPEPPAKILTRAVALAVENYLRSKMLQAVEDFDIDRGKR